MRMCAREAGGEMEDHVGAGMSYAFDEIAAVSGEPMDGRMIRDCGNPPGITAGTHNGRYRHTERSESTDELTAQEPSAAGYQGGSERRGGTITGHVRRRP
jgi:hypothetical protein